MNGKPVYRKIGNNLLRLVYTNKTGYPTPWTMWGTSVYWTRTHIGNIKIGPQGLGCPENGKVKKEIT